jgi:hypothetical protein
LSMTVKIPCIPKKRKEKKGFERTNFLGEIQYSLQPILLFTNTDVSITKICLDKSKLAKSIIDRRA